MRTETIKNNSFLTIVNYFEDSFIHILLLILKPVLPYINKKYREFKKFSPAKQQSVLNRMKITGGVTLFASMVMIMFFCFFSFSGEVHAQDEQILHKYYTSVYVNPGDTLWTIAGEYYDLGYENRKEYINEVMDINHLTHASDLQSGTVIYVPYYSYEIK